MNIIYIIFIVIILFSFVTGIFVTIAEAKEKRKYNSLLNSEEESNNQDTNTIEVLNSDNSLTEEPSTKIVVPEDININYIQDSITSDDSIIKEVDECKEPTIKLDNIEVLDNTIKLNIVTEKNIEKHNKNNSTPHLIPYSIVDDDII